MNTFAAAATATAQAFDAPVLGLSALIEQQAPVPAPLAVRCRAASHEAMCRAHGPELDEFKTRVKLIYDERLRWNAGHLLHLWQHASIAVGVRR